jgi:hypothetical protein
MRAVCAIGVAFFLCGACGGGDEGSGEPTEPDDLATQLFDQQELYWRYQCTCDAGEQMAVPADDPCVLSNAADPVERDCKENVLRSAQAQTNAYMTCQTGVWKNATDCLQTTCDLEGCLMRLNALGTCADLPATQQDAFDDCAN